MRLRWFIGSAPGESQIISTHTKPGSSNPRVAPPAGSGFGLGKAEGKGEQSFAPCECSGRAGRGSWSLWLLSLTGTAMGLQQGWQEQGAKARAARTRFASLHKYHLKTDMFCFTNQLHTCQPSQVFISVCFTVWVLGVCHLCICLLLIKKDSLKPTYSKAIR